MADAGELFLLSIGAKNCIKISMVFARLILVMAQVGHDVDHFTSPEGVPGVPETNFNNRPNSFKVLSPPRTCAVMSIFSFCQSATAAVQ
jgi:hypothetical protein